MKVEQLAGLELSYLTFTAIADLAARQIVAEIHQADSARAEVLGRPYAG